MAERPQRVFTQSRDRSLFSITPKTEAWEQEGTGRLGPLNVGEDKAGEGRAGGPEHPHLPLSQIGPSQVSPGGFGPKGGALRGEGVLGV